MRLTPREPAWSDARTLVADLGMSPTEEHVTMSTETHTMAGPLAAGAARPGAVTVAPCATLVVAYGTTPVHQGFGMHPSASWTKGAIATPATSTVFDRKNRPTRPLSELSP